VQLRGLETPDSSNRWFVFKSGGSKELTILANFKELAETRQMTFGEGKKKDEHR
jgi:hypothetical protein